MMTVGEFMDLCIDSSLCKVEIFSLDKGGKIWNGVGDDIPSEFENLEVESFDVPSDETMTFNVE